MRCGPLLVFARAMQYVRRSALIPSPMLQFAEISKPGQVQLGLIRSRANEPRPRSNFPRQENIETCIYAPAGDERMLRLSRDVAWLRRRHSSSPAESSDKANLSRREEHPRPARAVGQDRPVKGGNNFEAVGRSEGRFQRGHSNMVGPTLSIHHESGISARKSPGVESDSRRGLSRQCSGTAGTFR